MEDGGEGGGESAHLWSEQARIIGDYSIEGVNAGKEAAEQSPWGRLGRCFFSLPGADLRSGAPADQRR